MKDIKVGEYIRSEDGIIGKILEEDDIGKNGVCIDENFFDEWGEMTDFMSYTKIVNHSFDIIDLIEEGDYVNGYRIDEIGEFGVLIHKAYGIDRSGFSIPILQYGDEIKTIVTKEQFKNIEYGV